MFNISARGTIRKPTGENFLPKRTSTGPAPSGDPKKPGSRKVRTGIVHTSVYLPTDLYEGLRRAAFEERRKIHDIMLEGVRLALRKRGRTK